jgi:hypothetical protein
MIFAILPRHGFLKKKASYRMSLKILVADACKKIILKN